MSVSGRPTPSFLGVCFIIFFAFTLTACDGDDGAQGPPGPTGDAGAPGSDGLSCWDLNENGVADPEEDLNGDGVVDTSDCNAAASNITEAQKLHQDYFSANPYDGTGSCLNCHGPIGDDMLTKAHFTWQGVASNITGVEDQIHGKRDLINNFCIAVPTNEGRCSQCHAGYGWKDDTFTFSDPETVDCLICHDHTGDYSKAPTTAGLPPEDIDLNAVAKSVANDGGVPTRKACLDCHALAGGGDNVKHGDLALSMADTTREYDVHMGTDGANLACTDCHRVKKVAGELVDHGMGGMPYHSVEEGEMQGCTDCHGDRFNIHIGTTAENIVSSHTTLACQVCHIPAFARDQSTKTEWYWKEAGQDIAEEDIPVIAGRPAYDKKKGSFVWENDVRPSLLYFDGKWDRMMINVNDQYTETPVVLAKPTADYTTPEAMIYPFKKMIGNQVADANNNTMLVPHLFPGKGEGGPNAYWKTFDWDLAIRDGVARTTQVYSGEHEFVDTIMYLTVNHEIGPAETAFGMDNACADCHLNDKIDWQALGWTDDPIPLIGGTRP